uniref:Disease resistance R13L4/SHOC-2-like LRR domain-containing protein n=1 Tax=Globisporangium ultimum (strain ATCC 200006 / CBS 805.95 / DAOM BR144) TaxID=431595 RepID=K3WYP5_GLOUD
MDPLSLETWRLVIGMEILFGEHSKSTRLSGLTKEMKTKRKLIFSANSYNDFELFEDASKDILAKIEIASAAKDTSLSLVAQNLHCIPNAVLMMRHLTHLDLSGNDLVNFPESICQLTKLTVLKVAQNSLIELPSSLAKLSELRVLDVSHNNLSTIPGILWVHLVKIQELYLSANVLTHLPAPPLARLRDLRVLKIENNILSGENMKQICELLSAKCTITDISTDIVNNGGKDEVAKDHEDLGMTNQVIQFVITKNVMRVKVAAVATAKK